MMYRTVVLCVVWSFRRCCSYLRCHVIGKYPHVNNGNSATRSSKGGSGGVILIPEAFTYKALRHPLLILKFCPPSDKWVPQRDLARFLHPAPHQFFENRSSNLKFLTTIRHPRPFAPSTTRNRSHGHRTHCAIGARFPKATSHLPQRQIKGQVPQSRKGRTQMV
jgi:hypothetical protein